MPNFLVELPESQTYSNLGEGATKMVIFTKVTIGLALGKFFEKDERVWRVKWYAGLALFSELGLACASGITN